jgi:hypothetical protein
MTTSPAFDFTPLLFGIGLVLLLLFMAALTVLQGGWRALSQHYPATFERPGRWYYNVWGQTFATGNVFACEKYYKESLIGGLNVQVSGSGIGLSTNFLRRVFHPPLFIPWAHVVSVEHKDRLFGDTCSAVRVRNFGGAIWIYGEVGAAVLEAFREFGLDHQGLTTQSSGPPGLG